MSQTLSARRLPWCWSKLGIACILCGLTRWISTYGTPRNISLLFVESLLNHSVAQAENVEALSVITDRADETMMSWQDDDVFVVSFEPGDCFCRGVRACHDNTSEPVKDCDMNKARRETCRVTSSLELLPT